MTRKEKLKIQEAMRLFKTDDGYQEAMKILRILTGGPLETPLEKAIREAESVPITDIVKNSELKLPND